MPERGPGIGTGRDGGAPGANAAGMGQDTGRTHFFPNPVLTELTYKKKNTESVAIKLLFAHLPWAALVCRDTRVRAGTTAVCRSPNRVHAGPPHQRHPCPASAAGHCKHRDAGRPWKLKGWGFLFSFLFSPFFFVF